MDEFRRTKSIYHVLNQVVWVGYGFVVGGTLLLLLATCTFPQWRKKYQNQLFLHFAATRHLSNLLCMVLVTEFNDDEYDSFHSYELSSFVMCIVTPTVQSAASLWSLIFTKHLYDSFVVVIRAKKDHEMMKQVLLVWTTVVPLVLTTTMTAVTIALVCPSALPWPKFNLWYSVIMKWPPIFVNFVLYCHIVYCVLKTYNSTNRRSNKAVRTVFVFAILFVVMALQNLVDEMRPIGLNTASYDGYSIRESYRHRSIWITVNAVLLTVSYVVCFMSTAYWLWGNASDRKMWSSFIRQRVCRR